MDWNYVKNIIKDGIMKQCPQLPVEIINEYLYLTFFRAGWVTFCNKYSMHVIGIVETKDDFYYLGFTDEDNIVTASCALEFKRDKTRDNDLIIKWGDGNEKTEQEHWRVIRQKVKEYFNENKNEHLIYFSDNVLDDEHLVFDNEEHTEYHIEKIK
jgi:hypothetical protein